MLHEWFDFGWSVNSTGYVWAGDRLRAREGGSQRRYLPFGVRGLFLTFGELPLKRTDIQGFATQYGLLGSGQESLHEWVREIWRLRQAARLWEAVRTRDEATVKRYIRWDGDHTVIFRSPTSPVPRVVRQAGAIIEQVIAMRGSDGFAALKPGDVMRPARLFVQQIVNERLRDEVSPLLLRNETFAMGLNLVPKSLLGGLWLQFADTIDRNMLYRRCLQCGRPFAVGAGTARKSKLFCSDACKSMHYRARQANARNLAAQGRTVAEIAAQLDTDIETVKGWLER